MVLMVLIVRFGSTSASALVSSGSGVPGAELVTLSPAAHIPTVEQPLQVTGAILGHLAASGDER